MLTEYLASYSRQPSLAAVLNYMYVGTLPRWWKYTGLVRRHKDLLRVAGAASPDNLGTYRSAVPRLLWYFTLTSPYIEYRKSEDSTFNRNLHNNFTVATILLLLPTGI